MALLKFMGGIRLRATLVKCGITLEVALLDLTAGVILTAKKVAIRACEAPVRCTSTDAEWWGRYGCLEQQISRQHMWIPVPFLFPLATFFLCEDNKPIDLVILYCVDMPFYPFSTRRHETRSLATDFPLFNLDAGSMPTLLDSTVSLPFLIQPRHGLVCMK